MFNIFKPKYWANLFKYTGFFIFFCSLVHRLPSEGSICRFMCFTNCIREYVILSSHDSYAMTSGVINR